jgi:hypothetical protein
MKAVHASEISENFYQATRCDIPKDSTYFSLCEVIRMWIPVSILEYLKAFCFPLQETSVCGFLVLRTKGCIYDSKESLLKC